MIGSPHAHKSKFFSCRHQFVSKEIQVYAFENKLKIVQALADLWLIKKSTPTDP